ncbi:conjugal transfer protein [Streptomyces sp. NPDC058734]|uniref:conjugal transfer protein n=1 Tax=Streptomyces sp. NPDC058734 TaxID=3346615 RepID=UPI0036A05A25
MNAAGKPLTTAQKVVLGLAFVPMVGTGVGGGYGTYTNISTAYGSGTAVGAVAAGEGATAVLALVLLGLTMLGQSSPLVIRSGLWALPAAASAMSAMAAKTPGEIVIYALTPMGMTASAEGAAFLARRIVVHRDGRDAESERRAAEVVQALAYRRAMAAGHPDEKVRRKSELEAWKLARKVGAGDLALGERLLDVQRDRITAGADAALIGMFGDSTAPALPAAEVEVELDRPTRSIDPTPAIESAQTGAYRSTSDRAESADEEATPPALPAVEKPAPAKGDGAPDPVLVPTPRAVAADRVRPRRATGRVPEAARSTRTIRTADDLLAEARSLTESWSVGELTADRLRKTLRTSPANGRMLRDVLRGERQANTAADADAGPVTAG